MITIITHSIVAHDGTVHHVNDSRPVVVTNVYNQSFRGRVTGRFDGFVELRGADGGSFHIHRNVLASACNTEIGA